MSMARLTASINSGIVGMPYHSVLRPQDWTTKQCHDELTVCWSILTTDHTFAWARLLNPLIYQDGILLTSSGQCSEGLCLESQAHA